MTVYPSSKPWLRLYDKGVPPSLAPYPDHPLHAFLEQSARDYPDSPAVIFRNHKLTYRELDDLTDQLAAALADMGVKKGDRVGVYMPNSPQFPLAFYGILKAGATVATISPLDAPAQIEHKLTYSGMETMLVTSNFYNQFKALQRNTPVKRVIVTHIKEYMPPLLRTLFPLLTRIKADLRVHQATLQPGDQWLQDVLGRYTADQRPAIEIGPNDVAVLQFTGGTTGVPKAAIETHKCMVVNTLQIKSWLPDTRMGQEITLMSIPLFHVYGMVAGMSYSIAAAAALVMIPNPRDMDDLLDNIEKWKPTIFPGVPTMYNAINNHPRVVEGKVDVTSIRACISGSAPLLKETQLRFEELTGASLREGFGMSEAPTATHCNPMFGENRKGSIGLPLPDVECRIVSLEDEVTDLPAGEVGELVLHSPNLMNGYWEMTTETANALREGPDGKKWLYSGDIARMDEDGYFYIVDRKKDMVIVSGFNVYPTNVEEVLAQHPKVLEVAVAGIQDPYRGETVKAWVVLKPGQTATEAEMVDWAKNSGQLASYERPRIVEFRDELPKTMVGKVLRRQLVEETENSLLQAQG
jgi:long-chain acyl-CoA synthetase